MTRADLRLWFAIEAWPYSRWPHDASRLKFWDQLRSMGVMVHFIEEHDAHALEAVYEQIRQGGIHLTLPGPSCWVDRCGWSLEAMPYHPHWIAFVPILRADIERRTIDEIHAIADRYNTPRVAVIGSARQQALERARMLGRARRALMERIRSFYARSESPTIVAQRALSNPITDIPRLIKLIRRVTDEMDGRLL